MFRTADQLRRMAEACREALAAATDAQERAQIAAKLQALSDLASNEDWLAGRASQTAAPLTTKGLPEHGVTKAGPSPSLSPSHHFDDADANAKSASL